MKYSRYRISYISACTRTWVFDETFDDIRSALEWVRSEYGYALREPYFRIYGYRFLLFRCRITLRDLHARGLVGEFKPDGFGGGGAYSYK
jgi:hypothetical protein